MRERKNPSELHFGLNWYLVNDKTVVFDNTSSSRNYCHEYNLPPLSNVQSIVLRPDSYI